MTCGCPHLLVVHKFPALKNGPVALAKHAARFHLGLSDVDVESAAVRREGAREATVEEDESALTFGGKMQKVQVQRRKNEA